MAKNLVVVESPAKAKTIEKYLGKDFKVLASYGHVRDLINKNGAIDVDHDFAMHYLPIERNKRHVDNIVRELKKAEALYLATDPDREGEAISWHLYEMLQQRNLLKDKACRRVAFYEITRHAVNEAIANPRELSMDLVNAQQARRALDYLVGFNLSPLLWKKVQRGLSAGRVQSPALKMIVEREIDIEQFVRQEYWSIEADLKHQSHPFMAKLVEWQKEKLQQFSVTNKEQAYNIRDWLLAQADGELAVHHIEKKQRKRHPAPPFTTSTLQQEASRKLGFATRKTMQVAQNLYEGIDVGGQEGNVGLITYMRTDSVNLSNDAIAEIRGYIEDHYGLDQVPKSPRAFKTKSKNAQEAHEAIRPTSVLRHPDAIKTALTPDQYKLYQLIWKRTVACQMIHALIDTVAIDFLCGEGARFRANGSTVAHPGFMRVYQESFDDKKGDDSQNKMLPPMKIGDKVKLIDIRGEQHFTEPPPRYSEASLVKALEEYGIGRPSTYASIIATLQNRHYATIEKKRFYPTDVGRVVARFLDNYFNRYVEYNFTATLEDELDAISRGEEEWVPALRKFWSPFIKLIGDIDQTVQRKDVTQEAMDEDCPECGQQLSIRLGKSGRFIGCTGYPDCSYTRPLNSDGETQDKVEPEIVADRQCPECHADLLIKEGRYGKFIGCSAYPKCKHIESLNKPKDTGVICPQCHEGNILERRSKRGKTFFSCQRYPKCDYAIWHEPIAEVCPQCKWPILTMKTTKRSGTQKVCPQKSCDYVQSVDENA